MSVIYINCYECPQCGETWMDEYDGMPEMDCEACGLRHITPFDLESGPGYITALSGENTVIEADEAQRTPLQALSAYIEQMDKGETVPIIEMYERAALKAGCNPEVLRIAFMHHYQGQPA